MQKEVVIGTRGSKLALWQTEFVANRLKKSGISTRIKVIETKGDRVQDVSILKIGSKGVFTEEIEEQLRAGEIDIAVHSAKDLPSNLPKDLQIIAFTEREKACDVLLGFRKNISLRDPEIVIGTSSTRRIATLKHYYGNVKTAEIRGNLQTRIKKLKEGQCDALLLAYAGVYRMGYSDLIVQELPTDVFTPAVGQGSLAIESSIDLSDFVVQPIRGVLNHETTEKLLLAERAFLRELEGGCSIPAFALAELTEEGGIKLHAGIFSLDGKQLVRESTKFNIDDHEKEGEKLATTVLAKGGREILNDIRSKL